MAAIIRPKDPCHSIPWELVLIPNINNKCIVAPSIGLSNISFSVYNNESMGSAGDYLDPSFIRRCIHNFQKLDGSGSGAIRADSASIGQSPLALR
jgi:hypothetical protein